MAFEVPNILHGSVASNNMCNIWW